MKFFSVTFSLQTVKRYGHIKTILSLKYPGSATISISLHFSFRRWDVLRSRLDNASGVRLVTAQEAAVAVPGIVTADQYSWLNNSPGIPSQSIVVNSLYILYVL